MKREFVAKVMAWGVAVSMLWNPVAVFAAEFDEGFEENYVEEFEDEEYVEVSDQTVMEEQDDEAFVESIGMTDEELLDLYNDYVESNSSSNTGLKKRSFMVLEEDNSAKLLNGFVEYAAMNGIIRNNAAQKDSLKVSLIRAQFKAVVALSKGVGYSTASALLDHSLQNKPSNLAYSPNSKFAAQIAESRECEAIVGDFKKQVEGLDITEKIITGSTTLNSTTDLHLSYNKVSYKVAGKKVDGQWKLAITFFDRYDFEVQAWKNTMTSSDIVTIVNNYAAYAQENGAIVPYDIKITVEKSF